MDSNRILRILYPLALVLWLACSSATPPAILADLGERCDGTTEATGCKYGLVCAHDGTCKDPTDPQATGVAGLGDECGASEHCQFGLVCTADAVCGEPGSGGEGEPCTGANECLYELVCAGDGTCKDPDDPEATGVAGLNEECVQAADCQLGLICFVDQTCQAAEFWMGANCAASDEDEQDDQVPFKVYFEVPRGAVAEFYRLPFPNDIRITNGRVDLVGHPAPDTPLAGGLVGDYLAAIQDEIDGFSTQAGVFLRFSKRVDFDTLDLTGDDPNLLMVDITPDSPNYGWGPGVGMYTTTMRGKYICQNWLSMKPLDGYPLRHSTTYAVIVTSGISSSEGAALQRDDDFAAMLSSSQPGDGTMRTAWQAYQPLRDYLADDTVVTPGWGDRVMAAAVFTTMNPDEIMQGFRDKVRNCAGSDCDLLPDPGPQGLGLDFAGSGYSVLKGTLEVPVFQAGTPPYLREGGQVEFSGQGAPVIQRSEQVNFTLSVPPGAPPPNGWPVVIYAHGTGGGPDTILDNRVAETLASVEVTLDSVTQTVALAVLAIQAVQHGDRRGDTQLGPDLLYFNFVNPQAAKFNAVQGAADNFQLVRMIERMHQSPPGVSGLDHPVKLDSSLIFYFGHSQGSLTGPLFLAYSPAVKQVVFSGAGGNLIQSLLTKTQPVDIASATRLVLNDLDVGALHPMLNLFQLYFDPIDTANYASAMTRDPVEVGLTNDDPPQPILGGPHHVFVSFGRDDHYASEQTMISFARPLGVRQVNDQSLTCNCHDDSCDTVSGADELHDNLCRIRGLGETTTPARATDYWAGSNYTAVLKMYLAQGYDGHFVLFDHPEGPGDYSGFLGSAAVDPERIPTLFP